LDVPGAAAAGARDGVRFSYYVSRVCVFPEIEKHVLDKIVLSALGKSFVNEFPKKRDVQLPPLYDTNFIDFPTQWTRETARHNKRGHGLRVLRAPRQLYRGPNKRERKTRIYTEVGSNLLLLLLLLHHRMCDNAPECVYIIFIVPE